MPLPTDPHGTIHPEMKFRSPYARTASADARELLKSAISHGAVYRGILGRKKSLMAAQGIDPSKMVERGLAEAEKFKGVPVSKEIRPFAKERASIFNRLFPKPSTGGLSPA